MYATPNDDDMVDCPYNKYHRMTRRRLQPHLIKCRLSYPDVELCKCPFNATHLVPEPEFTHHVTSCPDKALLHQYKYNAVPLKIDEDHSKQLEVDCTENWDDTEADDYDPTKYASKANILRAHIGDLPSVKKEFRKNERKRLGDLDSSDEDEDKKFRENVYKDYECKQEVRDNGWYEDRGAASTSSGSIIRRRESYTESSSKDRGLGKRDDYTKRPIKLESDDGEEYTKKKKCEDYPLDEDPYYKTNNTNQRHSGAGGRDSCLRISRGTSRKRYN